MAESTDVTERTVREACAAHESEVGALLPILRTIQDRIGHISDEALRQVADELNMSRAQVFGVMTFYHDFRRKPAAAHTLKVCRAEACQSVGGRDIWAAASAAVAGNSAKVDVEAVYCLGNCACAPALRFDGRTLGRMDVPQLNALLAAAGGGEATP